MAPTRQRKLRKSTESQSSVDTSGFPAPPQTIPTKTSTPTRTPIRSPMMKAHRGLTANQKQALLDNLQLEITERARKLRAQYNLQAQGLRTRIEIRVNRIPVALRKAKMGDLVLKYSDTTAKQHGTNTILPGMVSRGSPARNLIKDKQRDVGNSPSPMRPPKRHSDEMLDKENDDLSNPKKRGKAAPAPRAASRTKQPTGQVLSPRSGNSRTAPQALSPARPPTSMASPGKSYLARPVSPTKPMSSMPAGGAAGILTNMVEKAKSARATATRKVTATSTTTATTATSRARKQTVVPPPAPRARRGRPSNSSESSDASQRTTIVTKPGAAKKEPVKRTVMGTIKGMAATRKTTTASAAPKPASVGRVLRKRGAA